MITQVFAISDNISIVVAIVDKNSFQFLYLVNALSNDTVYNLEVNGENIKSGAILTFDDFYNFKLYKVFSSEEPDSKKLGVANYISKLDCLKIKDNKYTNTKLLLNNDLIYKIGTNLDNRIFTSHFNNKPLFYKFIIEDKIIDFDNDEFIITDIYGNQINNYVVDDYQNTYTIFLDTEYNNEYYYSVNGVRYVCNITLACKGNPIIKKFSNPFFEFESPTFIEHIALYNRSNVTLMYNARLTYADDSIENISLDSIKYFNDYKNNGFKTVNKFVKSISITLKHVMNNENFDEFYLVLFNDSPIYLASDNNYYFKKSNDKNDNFIFETTVLEEFDLDYLKSQITEDMLSNIDFNSTYRFENNELILDPYGNIYFDITAYDMVLLPFQRYEEVSISEPILEYTHEYNDNIDFYKDNFGSIEASFKLKE